MRILMSLALGLACSAGTFAADQGTAPGVGGDQTTLASQPINTVDPVTGKPVDVNLPAVLVPNAGPASSVGSDDMAGGTGAGSSDEQWVSIGISEQSSAEQIRANPQRFLQAARQNRQAQEGVGSGSSSGIEGGSGSSSSSGGLDAAGDAGTSGGTITTAPEWNQPGSAGESSVGAGVGAGQAGAGSGSSSGQSGAGSSSGQSGVSGGSSSGQSGASGGSSSGQSDSSNVQGGSSSGQSGSSSDHQAGSSQDAQPGTSLGGGQSGSASRRRGRAEHRLVARPRHRSVG